MLPTYVVSHSKRVILYVRAQGLLVADFTVSWDSSMAEFDFLWISMVL